MSSTLPVDVPTTRPVDLDFLLDCLHDIEQDIAIAFPALALAEGIMLKNRAATYSALINDEGLSPSAAEKEARLSTANEEAYAIEAKADLERLAHYAEHCRFLIEHLHG